MKFVAILVVPSRYSSFFEGMTFAKFLQVMQAVRLHWAHYIKNDQGISSLHHTSPTNMLLKTSLGPLQMAFGGGAGFVGLFFLKEGFSLEGGNHQHLVLLLNHHRYS